MVITVLNLLNKYDAAVSRGIIITRQTGPLNSEKFAVRETMAPSNTTAVPNPAKC